MILYDFCNGYFGRDSYEDKRIEFVAYDYIVVRDINNVVYLYQSDEGRCLIDPEWLKDPYENTSY